MTSPSTLAFSAPIPLSEIEGVLAWVDTFKLSRPTKKINRDFSDAVLLAEILSVHYPKLVEMHNYPPRNSHALKLNNWMTLNRKVLKKLKLNLCMATIEQLSHATPGVIERVLVMVKDKIKRDEELEKSSRDAEQNMSSGGSFYEACGDEEHILVVPVKARVNGVLEVLQQKVVTYEAYIALKEELKDAKEAVEALKQKVDHLDNVVKLKEERIVELQKDLERKQSRHKKFEGLQNSLNVPFDDLRSVRPLVETFNVMTKISGHINVTPKPSSEKVCKEIENKETTVMTTEIYNTQINKKPSITEVSSHNLIQVLVKEANVEIDKVNSGVFKDSRNKSDDERQDEEFADSEQGLVVTIDGAIEKEACDIKNQDDEKREEGKS